MLTRASRFLPAIFGLIFLLTPGAARAQRFRSTEPDVGVRFNPPSVVALTNAKIVTSSDKTIDSGTLVIDDGRIIAVGVNVPLPAGCQVIDCGGDYLYPALIDPYVEFSARPLVSTAGHWNAQVTPQLQMSEYLEAESSRLESLRKAGVSIVAASPSSGIIKGQGCLMTTADGSPEEQMIRATVFQHIRLYPDRGSRGSYPNSPMGAVALVRQTLSDAAWYRRAAQAALAQPELAPADFNESLVALESVIAGVQPVVIDGRNELYALRADKLAREFSLKLIVRGSGREYRCLDAIAETNRPYIIPVDFPEAPKVSTQEEVDDATLQELMHWNLAPENAARLDKADVDFVFTSDGLGDVKDYLANIRIAVRRGLSEKSALEALTLGPATLLDIQQVAGTLERGKMANLLRTDGPLFKDGTALKETWVNGQRYDWNDDSEDDLRGVWSLALEGDSLPELELELSGKVDSPKATIGLLGAFDKNVSDGPADAEDDTRKAGDKQEEGDGEGEEIADASSKDDTGKKEVAKKTSVEVKGLKISPYALTGSFQVDAFFEDQEGTARLSSTLLKSDADVTMRGVVTWPDGTQSDFTLSKRELPKLDDTAVDVAQAEGASEDAKENDVPEVVAGSRICEVNFPLGAYGVTEPPAQAEWLLFRDATIWTCGEQGILEEADLLVHDGLVDSIGIDLTAPEGATIVEAKGMHISPGVIDCHSHMATDGGVNESGQAITAEVRIGDFIDPNDITIYRQLAGGVTSSNILHGSANPIGGQNQVIKLRWGSLGEEMKMAEAPAGIKFALGENVKQSSRRDDSNRRYPQTRMGVEQIMRDRFEAAKLYRKAQSDWTSQPNGLPPRKDYELEAIVEILEGKRWIHCHSYRQDEILTMLRTLEDYDITIGSLQHILEGYKVADAMAAHGAMGSSFSDWWAYKFEVYDAIPFNGAVMHRAGVVVSFNSDDRELARHLNHEAAKAVKYGGLSEEEALKFVTLNPAKQLRIDQWVGSLEPGKHADFVVWNRSPLSTMSACEQTWIDGRKYFDRADDHKRRDEDAELHRQLVEHVISSGAKTGKRRDDDPSYWWARYDEFCHHNHNEHDHEEHSNANQE